MSWAKAAVALSPPAGVGGGGGSVLGGAWGASVGAGGGGTGTGINRAVALGPAGCTSSSPAGLVVVVLVVVAGIVVTGMTAGASVVGGPVGSCVRATVKLREGAAGGSVGLAVIFGGPGKKSKGFITVSLRTRGGE